MPDLAIIRRRIAGEVLEPSDQAYATVLSDLVWNGLKPDRRPGVIVRAAHEADVVEAVRCAREQNLKVVVRGGGHSWCGLAVRDGGMLIDLARLNDVTIDAATRMATTQPVVSNRDLIRQLSVAGLCFPVGHCPTVKVSGFLLSGGVGWNSGHWGHACHSVDGIDVVTAAGELVHASSTQNTDLFWAARGGGAGFFGVATRYYLRLYPMPQAIWTSTYHYPLERLEEIGHWLGSVTDHLPSNVELTVYLTTAPPELADRSASSDGKVCMITATAFADTDDEAAAALAPMESCPAISACLARSNEPTPFETLFDNAAITFPPDHRYQVETLWSTRPTVDVLLAVRDHFVRTPSPRSVVLFAIYSAWTNFQPPEDAAFSMAARTYGGAWTIWEREADDAANITWHRECMELFAPITDGHYLGETDIVDDPTRAPASFSPENWRRLHALRERYDPDGLFQGFSGGLP